MSTLAAPNSENAAMVARVARMKANPPTIADKVKGGVEAALNVITSLTNYPIGVISGVVGNTATAVGEGAGAVATALDRRSRGVPTSLPTDPHIGDASENLLTGKYMQDVTYQPKTDVGQDYAEDYTGPAMNALGPAIGHGHEVAHAAPALAPAVRAAGDATRPVARAAAAAAERGVGAAGRAVLNVDPELAKVAQIAGDLKHPIDVRPDQIIEGAKFSKLAGQAAADVPLSNSKTKSNQVAFTRNLIDMLNPEETKAERLTPDVFDKAMTRSGEGIGEITARTPVPEGDLMPGVKGVDLSKATEDNRRIVSAYVADIQAAAEEGGGKIDGTRLTEINSEIGKQARTNADSDLGRYLNDLQDVIQDSVERNATPEDVTALRDFRRQYAYGKMVEPLVAKTIDGKISPQGLMARVTATKQGKHFMARAMGGPIGDLAKVGQLIKEPGTSLTTERGLIYGTALGGGAYVEPHTAAAAYTGALGYNTLGPKLTRAMVGKRPPKPGKPPPPAEPPGPPPEPTTSPGAGGGGGGGTPPPTGPLGDLTPDWGTTPGAGGGPPRGGHEPGLVRPVDEPSPTTGNRKTKLEIPAVPGRPDLPDALVTGGPAESAATARANAAMHEPGAIEARQQQAEAAERARRAAEPRVPVGEVKEGQPPIKAEAAGKIPVGKATEGQPEIKPFVPKKPLKAGEATELPVERIEPKEPIPEGEVVPLTAEQEKAWRKEFGLGDGDAERAKAVATALKHDEKAVEAAAAQHEHSPRAFDREIERINEEAKNANESQRAAEGSESPAGAGGTPVREGERGAPVHGAEVDKPVPTARSGAAGKSEPEPAAAVRAADQQSGADRVPAAGTERAGTEAAGGRAPAGAEGARGVEIREVPGGFEAYRDGRKVGYLKDNLERGQAKQLGESANVDMVKVDKDEQGKGTGRALYKAFEDKHEGAIMPSGKTEPSAWKLWKRNYPDKVDAFVKQEAQRIKDGADPKIVAGNITDPEVRARVLKESEPEPPTPPSTKKAVDIAREMSEMQKTKPRPLAKLFGTNGPTPAQKLTYDAQVRKWNSEYRKLQAAHKIALDRDNAAFRAAQQGKTNGADTKPDNQPGDLQQKAGEKGVPKDEPPEEIFSTEKTKEVADSPAFKKWFGESHVVDKEGKPLVVYHGTNQEHEAFDAGRLGTNTQASSSKEAFFFTSHAGEAGEYADLAAKRMIPGAPTHEAKTDRLMKAVDAAERTAHRTGDWSKHEALLQELESHEYGAINDDPSGANVMPTYLSLQNPKIVDVGGSVAASQVTGWIREAKAAGHDGLILRNISDGPTWMGDTLTDHYAVFKPEQIKSAIGNRGTFDPTDPNILHKQQVDDYKSGEPVRGAPVGSPEKLTEVLRDKFGSKIIDGLIDQGLLKFALARDEGMTPAAGRGGVRAVFRQKIGEQPAATLYFDRLTAEQAPALLMHELGEHFGAPRLLGPERYALVMDELKSLAKTDPEVQAAWKHVEHNYIGEGTPDNVKVGDDLFMREVAAHLVETQPDLPWVRRFINEVRAFFYEHFGTTMGNRVDANLIRGMAAAALRKASAGKLAGQQPTARQFKPFVPSRTVMGANRPTIQ
jgi:GNAT superfamily N-acetyltransferase